MAAINVPMMKTYPIILPIKRSFGASHWEYDAIIADQKILITVTSNSLVVNQWITRNVNMIRPYDILGRLIIGFDSSIGTIQVCIGRCCLVYQISVAKWALGVSALPVDFLNDQNNLFVGIDIRTKMSRLQRDYPMGNYAVCMDLGSVVAGVWNQGDLATADLKRLAEVVMKIDFIMSSPAVVSNPWDNIELTLWQVLYATVNAFLSFEIARILNNRQLLPRMPSQLHRSAVPGDFPLLFYNQVLSSSLF